MSRKNEPGMAYNTKKLNFVFLFLSFLLLISTLWLFLDDYIRPWKKIQLDAMAIKQKKIKKEMETAEDEIKEDDLARLKKKMETAEKEMEKKNKLRTMINQSILELDKRLHQQNIITGNHNAMMSQLQFEYGIAFAKHEDYKSKNLLRKLSEEKRLLNNARDKLKELESKKKKAQKRLHDSQKAISAINEKIKKMTGKHALLVSAMKAQETDAIFLLRNAPMMDFLNPTLKIHQIVPDNITDDRYFQQVAKVDRCTTCHTFIDKPGYEKEPNPHRTHPNLDLILGAKSPHPMNKIGCTVCHGGEGHRVHDMVSVAHMPSSKEQQKEWVKKYNWHPPHKVPKVMYKNGYAEAGCVKCHQQEEYIPEATVLNEGRRNINRFGCYACHKIKGWEHKKKPGPDLLRISGKISKEFFKNWVWDPKGFNKHARMPSFFSQDNNSKEEFMKKNITEVVAMTEFIWHQSDSYKPFFKYKKGNKSKGKKLIKEVGCLGCHGVEGLEEESKKIDAMAGPYLTGIGSKVSADWLASWLKRPSHYQNDTIMPSFRLTRSEVQDITAYLMSLENKQFESLRFAPLDPKLRDELLVEYFSTFDTVAMAGKKLSSMTSVERTLELGKRVVGKYGCYSCHDISGFEGRVPIGIELTNMGSKPVSQLGFNHEHDVEHSLDGWLKAHLLNPRRWDNGMERSFKDLLRMPNFNMTKRQAETITVALLGQTSDYIPLAGTRRFTPHEELYNEAMKVMGNYNCIGCHQVKGLHGDILRMYEDINEGPPRLVDSGHRVQTKWLFEFLGKVSPIRPELKVRMPSFNLSHEEKNKIVTGLQVEHPTFSYKTVRWEKGEKKAAGKLFRRLDCATCHTQGFNKDKPTAPDLRLSSSRLRPSWIEKWLSNPNAILEGTVMPNFWEDGVSMEPDILGGDPKRQIRALTKYIMDLTPKRKKGRR